MLPSPHRARQQRTPHPLRRQPTGLNLPVSVFELVDRVRLCDELQGAEAQMRGRPEDVCVLVEIDTACSGAVDCGRDGGEGVVPVVVGTLAA